MTPEYWQKQLRDAPLFEDILWSRPEHKQGAGKLLVVGGNAMGFAAIQEAYSAADKAGAGVIHTVMPDALRKIVGTFLQDGNYAPSTPSGSFAKLALTELIVQAQWADAVLLAGDFGRNSETAVLLEQFVQKYQGQLILTKDAVDYFSHMPELILKRQDTVIVLSMAQLQKLATAAKHPTPFLLSMGLMLIVQALHDFTNIYPVTIVTRELDSIVVAHAGKVSSTKVSEDEDIWRVKTAAAAAVFWMQNKNKPFEAITTSLTKISNE
jgi:hypothetical protein